MIRIVARIAAVFLVAAGLMVLAFTLDSRLAGERARKFEHRPPPSEGSEFADAWRFHLTWARKGSYVALGTVDGRVLLVGSGALIAAGVVLWRRS